MSEKRMYVLDTNVLMQDPTALFRFQEHDVYLPMVVLEELDAAKKGTSEIARNVREVSRILDEVVRDADDTAIGRGILLPGPASDAGPGRLFLQTRTHPDLLPDALPGSKPDNGILNVARALHRERPERGVVVVSRDINLRIKARALGNPGRGLPRRRRPRRRLSPLPRRVPGARRLLGRATSTPAAPGRRTDRRTTRSTGRRPTNGSPTSACTPADRRARAWWCAGSRTDGRCWSPCATTGPEPTPCGA